MKLSNRLEAVANFVPFNSVLLDIGTDHAMLPIYLCEEGQIKKAYASDNKEGPLTIAKNNIAVYGLSNKISTLKSDGIKDISSDILNEVSCVTIAGMGGILIRDILSVESWKKVLSNKSLVLQPNSNAEDVRRQIVKMGFAIVDETIVYEDGHYYEIIYAQIGESDYEELDYKYGPVLRREKSPYFYDYMNKRLDDLNRILEAIDDEESPKYQETKYKMIEISRVIEF